MVASSCARKEPSTATVVIFQTNGSSPPDSLEALGKGGQDLIGGANASETREDIFKGEAVMLGVLAGAGIFDEHEGKAQAGPLTRGGLDACIGGDACEDDRVDAFLFQAEDGIRDSEVTGVQTCALPICLGVRAREQKNPVGVMRAGGPDFRSV